MQYSALLALSSALMAAGVASERVAVPYGMNPAQAAAMGSAMNAPWAVPPPSAPSQSSTASKSMVSMHSSMKHPKATIIPGVANSAMAFPSMAPMSAPVFPSMSAMATPSPWSRGSNGPSRNGMNHKHGVHHAHDSFRAPQGETHGIEQSSNGWHEADGFSQGSNGVGNTAGMGQDASNESQGNEDSTPDESPRPETPDQGSQPQPTDSQTETQDEPSEPQGPPPAQQPQDQSPEDPAQNQEQQPSPQPQESETAPPDTNQAQNQDQPAQAPQPPANDAPPSTDQGSNSPGPQGNTDDTPSPPHGGLAPVSPMQPGSNVAPMGFDHKTHGQDIGNAFCLGQCYPSEEEAKCGEPYVSIPPLTRELYQLCVGVYWNTY